MGTDKIGLVARMQQLLRAPVSQPERIRAGSSGLAFLLSSIALILLRGMSNVPIFGVFLAIVLALFSGALVRRYPEKKGGAILIGSIAGIIFINAFPGLRIIGNIIMGLGIGGTAILAAWKLGSLVYSIFAKKR